MEAEKLKIGAFLTEANEVHKAQRSAQLRLGIRALGLRIAEGHDRSRAPGAKNLVAEQGQMFDAGCCRKTVRRSSERLN